jgi:uncharacterized membrane protein
MNPALTIHLAAAVAAIAIGPFALWTRQGSRQRPRLHRAFGYAWVTLMVITAVSALFLHDPVIPGIYGFGPIHLLVPFVFYNLYRAFAALARGDIATHRQHMLGLYYGASVTAGVFALLPQRYLGNLLWTQWLGLPALAVWPLLAAMVAIAVLALAATMPRRPRLIAA